MKDKFVKFLKFGYVSENVITYGIFFIAIVLYYFNRWRDVDVSINLTDTQDIVIYIIVFYFRYVKDILVILLIKFVLEYFVQNQRLLRKIASSNNTDSDNTNDVDIENISAK